jgi:hypothetical protein
VKAALLLLLLACGDDPPPAGDPLGAWPTEPHALAAFCPTLPYLELVITCRVQAAADLGRAGESDPADAVCAEVPDGTWREECHFRAGEELGRAGHTLSALRHCARAGWFGRNCLTHTAWNLPADPDIGPDTPAQTVGTAAEELDAGVQQALAGAGDGLPGEGRELVLARYGYNVYVGRGAATPAAAHLDGPAGPTLRTGFAIEAVRLLEAPTVDGVLAVWRGEAPVPTGDALPPRGRMGRYSQRVLSPHERGRTFAPTFGGGARLVGETPEEDVVVAALEALFWREQTPSEAFLPWVDDPREHVRWTAARLLRLAGPAELDLPATLERLATEHPDENVRWHARSGLEKRTWERPRRPRR